MLKKFCLLPLFTFFLIIGGNKTFCQFSEPVESSSNFFFDAICFKAQNDTLSRIDVYVIVPYQSVYFVKIGDYYGAQFDIRIKVTDTSGKLIKEENISRKLNEKNYFDAQGGTAKFDFSQTIFNLAQDKYDIEVILTDSYSKKTYQRSRRTTALNFSKFKLAVSGIMLVSSIEENNGKFIITPHISDNIGDLKDGFFAFFETYKRRNIDSLDFIYQLINSSNNVIFTSERFNRKISNLNNQEFLKIVFPKNQPQGTYILKIIALEPGNKKEISEADYLAIAERSVKNFHSFGGTIMQDINQSIRQLRYVANQSDIDYIESGTTTDEKQRRFEEYWIKLDPTLNTERNEAYEQYYARIEIANKRYKSYNEGWLTDMGMVFIIFGEPSNIERSSPYSDGRIFVRWNYGNGRQYIFVDNSGFGDFRLYSPYTVTEKYHYGN